MVGSVPAGSSHARPESAPGIPNGPGHGGIGKPAPTLYYSHLMKATFPLLIRILGLLGLVAPLVSGCDGDRTRGDAPPASFAGYYAGEIFLVEKTRIEMGDSALLDRRLDSLRLEYGLTRETRDSLIAYCRDSLPRWEAFLKDVLARLEKREKEARGTSGNKGAAVEKDTAAGR
jgi:hypothetical protein